MRVEVEFSGEERPRSVDLPPLATGMDLVRALGLSPNVHLLLRESAPIPEDEALADGDRIRVIGVVSGG